MSAKRIVVIGAGPGGYVAAVHAAHLKGMQKIMIRYSSINLKMGAYQRPDRLCGRGVMS